MDDTLSVMVWHYHDDDVPGPAADVELTFAACQAPVWHAAHAAFPHRRGAQQLVHGLEENGLAAGADDTSNTPNSKRPANWPNLKDAAPTCKLTEARPGKNLTTSPGCFVTALRAAGAAGGRRTPKHPRRTSTDDRARKSSPVPPAIREKFELDPFYQQVRRCGRTSNSQLRQGLRCRTVGGGLSDRPDAGQSRRRPARD